MNDKYKFNIMSIIKQTKDLLIKALLGKASSPSGLVELNKYFRLYDPINFRFEKQDDGSFVALSTNFRYGSIVVHAKKESALEQKIVDAILTSFEVPSSYATEAQVHRVGKNEYAFA